MYKIYLNVQFVLDMIILVNQNKENEAIIAKYLKDKQKILKGENFSLRTIFSGTSTSKTKFSC